MAIVFSDDFESGDFSNWTTEVDTQNHLSVSASALHHGSNGVLLNQDNGSPAYIKKVLNDPLITSYTRFYFKLDNDLTIVTSGLHSLGSSLNTAGDWQTPWDCQLSYDGENIGIRVMGFDNDDNGIWCLGSPSWYDLSKGAWHRVEIKCVIGDHSGILAFKLDGELLGTAIDIDNDNLTPKQFILGDTTGYSDLRGIVFTDCFVIDDTDYPGSDEAPPPLELEVKSHIGFGLSKTVWR